MEDNKIVLDLNLIKFLLIQESQKLVGKCMKRFELSNNKNEIKKQIKEIIYESFRDFYGNLETGKLILINNNELKKSEEKNG